VSRQWYKNHDLGMFTTARGLTHRHQGMMCVCWLRVKREGFREGGGENQNVFSCKTALVCISDIHVVVAGGTGQEMNSDRRRAVKAPREPLSLSVLHTY
jgi:hypothetical protein